MQKQTNKKLFSGGPLLWSTVNDTTVSPPMLSIYLHMLYAYLAINNQKVSPSFLIWPLYVYSFFFQIFKYLFA